MSLEFEVFTVNVCVVVCAVNLIYGATVGKQTVGLFGGWVGLPPHPSRLPDTGGGGQDPPSCCPHN